MKRDVLFSAAEGWPGSVFVNGIPLSPEYSQRVFNHSPDGFAWGYGGSGPAQLALALLLDAGLDAETATKLHQSFKDDVIANLPQETCERSLDVEEWVRSQEVLA